MKTGKYHSDEHIRNVFIDLYNKWWLTYSRRVITGAVLDEAYESGKKIVEKYKCDLSLDLFVDLFRELEGRKVS